MLGVGISEKLFKSNSYSDNYELGMSLTYKVSKTRQGKTTKTKKCINPNLIFTAFSVFCDKSPGVVCKDLCDWIQSNLEIFKSNCFMGMASRDLDFENWFRNLKSNDTDGDEFCLSALCQAFQRHALVVGHIYKDLDNHPHFLQQK